ncbi:MAG TPA: hypothetical protein VK524_34500 [Polyangiaceae bacterium]|nr:hypothetical protein [Polyangiaceae bacterium]
MPHTRMILGNDEVVDYLEEHGLVTGHVEPNVALLQRNGMASGQPAVQLIVEIEGRKHVVKTSLPMLETIAIAMRAASGVAKPP